MAVCDVCGNFDESYLEEGGFNDEWNDIRKKSDENYQPNLYYYWHGDIQEDYQMPKGHECLCEGCYEDLLSDNKIIEKHLDNGKINPIWNNDTMGWYMPIEEVAQ